MRTALFLVALSACGSSGNAHPDAAPDAFNSTCGQPGDTGNNIGVGKFCSMLSDCNGNMMATLCSSLGDVTTHFCTKTCTNGGSADQCGAAATCTCSGGCGCVPNACLQ